MDVKAVRSAVAAIVAATLAIATAACERETRHIPEPSTPLVDAVRLTSLTAGGPQPSGRERSPFQDNAHGISEGKRLFSAFNCTGCHAHGGGAIGPALMDGSWIYGFGPDQIFASIVQGRPNGMPSFGARLTQEQVWQLVAYVQSLSAETPRDAAAGREDDLAPMPPELRLDRLEPRQTGPR